MPGKNFVLYVRNFIFGAEDSLVSTVGLLSGVAIGGVAKVDILLPGMVLIFVEAFSMAVGSFLAEFSVRKLPTAMENASTKIKTIPGSKISTLATPPMATPESRPTVETRLSSAPKIKLRTYKTKFLPGIEDNFYFKLSTSRIAMATANQPSVSPKKFSASFFWPSRYIMTGQPRTKDPATAAEKTNSRRIAIGPRIVCSCLNQSSPLFIMHTTNET